MAFSFRFVARSRAADCIDSTVAPADVDMSAVVTEHGEHEAREAHEAPLHARSFKLRFAAQRELGRSYVSAVKPLTLPAVVRAKFYRCSSCGEEQEAPAMARVSALFRRGPREKYDAPVTTSHEYGWWWDKHREHSCGDRRLQHHIQDSAWLKERLRVLATDIGLKKR